MPTNGQVYLPTGTNDSAYQRARNAYQRALVPANGYQIDGAYQRARNAYQRAWVPSNGYDIIISFHSALVLTFSDWAVTTWLPNYLISLSLRFWDNSQSIGEFKYEDSRCWLHSMEIHMPGWIIISQLLVCCYNSKRRIAMKSIRQVPNEQNALPCIYTNILSENSVLPIMRSCV